MSKRHNIRNWHNIRRRVFKRDGFQCKTCGKRANLECHHIVHLQDGGSNDLSNLETICRACHIALHKPDRKRVVIGQDEWENYLLGEN